MPLTDHAALDKDRRTANAAPQLQHRHFAFIADVIGASGESIDDIDRWAGIFASKLSKTNGNFDKHRFFRAVMEARK